MSKAKMTKYEDGSVNIGGGIILPKETVELFEHPEKLIKNKKITEHLLIDNGAEQRYGAISEDYYTMHICDNNYHLEFSPYSNMDERDWNVHVDNQDFQSIGSANIGTTEHFNNLMKTLNIPYELH